MAVPSTAVPSTAVPQTQQLAVFVKAINEGLDDIYFGTSLVSVFFVALVILSFITIPKMRRHPADMLFNRTMLDLVMCLCHVAAYGGVVSRAGPDLVNPDKAAARCQALSFFYQVALFGSNSWYFVLSVDLFLAVRNPFSCHADYVPYYYVFVYTASLVTGIVLATGKYGVTIFNYCWVNDDLLRQGANTSTANTLSAWTASSRWVWGIYYGPHLVLCIVSVAVVVFTTVALKRGLPASGETRRRVVRFGFYYVVAFAVEWALRLVLYLVQDQYLLPQALRAPHVDSYRSRLHGVAVAFAVLEGLRGFFDFLLWFGTGSLSARELHYRLRRAWSRWTGAEDGEDGDDDDAAETGVPRRRRRRRLNEPLLDEKSPQTMEVSSVLRHDMIICTSWGIVDSAPVNVRPPNLAVTGFEDSLRAHTLQQIAGSSTSGGVEEADEPVGGDARLQLQLSDFDAQRSGLQLWLRSTDSVRGRHIHCPSALQSTTFDFRDYAPEVFSCVRSLRAVDPISYCKSFNVAKSHGASAMAEKFTEGRSGSFFYFTHDSRYIVKTATDGEAALLNQHVRDYFFHLHSNPDSLLTCFFGLHAMRLSPEQKYISLMVMENIFPTEDYLRPTERYDLKGSWVARKTLKGKNLKVPRSKLTLKDGDLNRKIRIGPAAKARLLAQLRRDVGFLASIGIMDYSLLIGLRDFDTDPRVELPSMEMRDRSKRRESRGPDSLSRHRDRMGYVPPSPLAPGRSVPSSMAGASLTSPPVFSSPQAAADGGGGRDTHSTPWHKSFYGGLLSIPPETSPLVLEGSSMESAVHELGNVRAFGSGGSNPPVVRPEDKVWSIYYMGLIDILQRYNFSKKVEHFFKANVRCMDSHGISAVNVNEYATRFIDAMNDIFV